MEILNADGTPVRRRLVRKRRSAWARGRAFLAPILVAIAVPVAFNFILQSWSSTTGSTGDGLPPVTQPSGARSTATTAAGSTRVVYPYSIVAGGVHSADDARAAVASDPVVARHYRDVVIDALQVETVTSPRAVYVSYRRGNEVFWTKKKLVLHPGEMLLSDGANQVRARCGNRVSEQWQTPVSDVDPPAAALEQAAPIVVPEQVPWPSFAEWEEPAPFTAAELASQPLVARQVDADPLPGAPLLLPGLLSLAGSSRIDSLADPGDFGTVPEPGTLVLVGLGLAGALLRLRRTGARRLLPAAIKQDRVPVGLPTGGGDYSDR